ncbi:DUF5615 family PIN-like protein [Ekhidna sp.]|uniref:DUF5615 family PIN-like protein n=1 Tax=Ekhidna sp. TaxID=2608089 RepID=UPI003CCC1005
MKFLADENFPGSSVAFLRERNIDVRWISEVSPGISDEEVIKFSNKEGRTILTHDSDYGELIYKSGHKPNSGVIYFRLSSFKPSDPGKILLEILESYSSFSARLVVIDGNSIRERKF